MPKPAPVKQPHFYFPFIQQISERARPGIRVLVLAPTRELALQIEKNYSEFNSCENQSQRDCDRWRKHTKTNQPSCAVARAVLIATPGRLLDLTERQAVNLSAVEVLVLDEADRMLDMGFLPAIRRVLSMLPTNRQTVLFSATMSASIEQLARSTMKEPQVDRGKSTWSGGDYGRADCLSREPRNPRRRYCSSLLEKECEPFERVLVFTRTRRGAERLSHILKARDHSVNRIHADRTQPQREAALREFQHGRTRVLVATDIAARGLDVERVSHVINYDVPAAPEDYVHRVGRTGRAGNQGKAITIVAPVDESSMRAIERLTGQAVKRVVPEGFGGVHTCLRPRSNQSPAPLAPRSAPFVRFVRVARDNSFSHPSRQIDRTVRGRSTYGRETDFNIGDRVEQMCITCGEERGHIVASITKKGKITRVSCPICGSRVPYKSGTDAPSVEKPARLTIALALIAVVKS